MTDLNILPALEYSTDIIIDRVLSHNRRVLLFGEPGSGKSTLATELAGALANAGRSVRCIGADPGAPTFGIPGTVCLGEWRGEHWERISVEALCNVDAGRFRLPLVSAIRRLTAGDAPGVLFIDAPGVVRGVAGAELLVDLVEVAGIDVVLVLVRAGAAPPYPSELAAIASQVFVVPAPPAPHRARPPPGSRPRHFPQWLGHRRARHPPDPGGGLDYRWRVGPGGLRRHRGDPARRLPGSQHAKLRHPGGRQLRPWRHPRVCDAAGPPE